MIRRPSPSSPEVELSAAAAQDVAAHRRASGSSRRLCVHLLPDTVGAGAENQARNLVAGMREEGEFDVELVYFNAGPMHESFEALDVPLRHVPRGRRFGLLGRAKRLRAAYSERPPDLLQTWLLEGNIVGLLAARAWPQTAVVISQRGSWKELEYSAHVRVQRLLMGRADGAISNSEGGADTLTQLGFPPELVSVVPNGIAPEKVSVTETREAVRARHGWTDEPLIAWVGRDNDLVARGQKDLATMLEAMRDLRSNRVRASLVVLGLTRGEIATAGLEAPEWLQALGWVDRPADYLNACDVVAISSRIEGHSNVAGEALMLGLPVATTACGSHCPVVERSGGKVVEIGNAGALAAGISDLLEEPPPPARVRELAGEVLSVEAMVDATLAVYRDAMSSREAVLRAA